MKNLSTGDVAAASVRVHAVPVCVRSTVKVLCAAALLCAVSGAVPRSASAYSPLTSEAIVNTAWDSAIKPLLSRKYAGATDAELRRARAYAYGGCVIQDLGFYPHGAMLFTELLHYVRSGEFVANLVNDAEPIEEYAFALGALGHYIGDSTGHPMATNRVVPMLYPKDRRRYGARATYEDDPTAHLQVEFSFDVLQVARGRYTPDVDHDFIGFAVSKSVLERAFFKTYGLLLREVFDDVDLAIEAYRNTVTQIVPEATKVAWEMKKDEIVRESPGITAERFVYAPAPGSFEKEWGNAYERSHWWDSVLAFIFHVTPKLGPLEILNFKPLTPETQQLFFASFDASVERYEAVLRTLGDTPLHLVDVNLDTGKPPQIGTYKLADKGYAALVDALAARYFTTVTPALRRDIIAFYGKVSDPGDGVPEDGDWRTRTELAQLRATAGSPQP